MIGVVLMDSTDATNEPPQSGQQSAFFSNLNSKGRDFTPALIFACSTSQAAPFTMSRARKSPAPETIPAVSIDGIIHTIRGERVILDADLAKIYGVKTKVLNQAVRRNREKFPADFLLKPTAPELLALHRSQIVTGSQKHRDTRSRPFAFTEHGALMAASILNSPQATQMSVFVIRAFIKMRGLLTDTRELARKLASLETELKSRLDSHESAIVDVLQRVMRLLDPPLNPSPGIPDKEMGFHTTLTKPPGK